MSIPPLPPPIDAFDASGRVAIDTACVRCGYNLRTLLADGVCPECGETVAASIQEFFLHFAPPSWVRDLARGLRLVMIGLGCLIVLPVAVGVIVSLIAIFNLPSTLAGPSWLMLLSGAIQFITQVAGQIFLIFGLVLLTHREPRNSQQVEGYTARRVIRLCCWLLPIPAAGNLVLTLLLPTFPPLTPGAPPPPGLIGPWVTSFAFLAAALVVVAMGIYTIATLAVLRHLATLLRRIPRPGLVRGARVAFWGLLCCTGLLLFGYGVVLLVALPRLPAALATVSAASTTTAPTTLPTPTAPVVSVTTEYFTRAPAAGSQTAIPADTQPIAPSAADESQAKSQPATSPLATAPATMPVPPIPGPSFLVGMLLGGCGAGVGGCGTLVFSITALIVMLRACGALFATARAADAIARG